mmetsp:Transcript_6066/g.13993  ORF Transcript_6066/g.13993 Transcript_6066/m.13993 type:complete len:210 (+) Transcript_6066:214-843(+)
MGHSIFFHLRYSLSPSLSLSLLHRGQIEPRNLGKLLQRLLTGEKLALDLPSWEPRHFLLLAHVALAVCSLLVALDILEGLFSYLPPKELLLVVTVGAPVCPVHDSSNGLQMLPKSDGLGRRILGNHRRQEVSLRLVRLLVPQLDGSCHWLVSFLFSLSCSSDLLLLPRLQQLLFRRVLNDLIANLDLLHLGHSFDKLIKLHGVGSRICG